MIYDLSKIYDAGLDMKATPETPLKAQARLKVSCFARCETALVHRYAYQRLNWLLASVNSVGVGIEV